MADDDLTADHPQVITRPPYIYLAAVVIGWLLHLAFPLPFMPDTISGLVAGGAVFLLALGIVALAFRQFRAAQTSIDPYRPSSNIISTGLFAISRNPVYVAMTIALIGIAMMVNSLWILALTPVVLVVMHFGVVKREEAYLDAKFGEAYRAYKQRVRRWL